jgi:small-conductance mechanosensitive channel
MLNGFSSYILSHTATFLDNIIGTLATVALGYFGLQFINKFLRNSIHKLKVHNERIHTMEGLIENTISVVVWTILAIMLFSQWGFNIAPILAGAGIVGLAIGFGTQALVRDIVTGFFVIIENQYNKGDVVQIAGVKGRVEQINLRTTILIDDEGVVHTVPNGQVSLVAKISNAPQPAPTPEPVAPSPTVAAPAETSALPTEPGTPTTAGSVTTPTQPNPSSPPSQTPTPQAAPTQTPPAAN